MLLVLPGLTRPVSDPVSSARRARVRLGDEGTLHDRVVELAPARCPCHAAHARQRIVRDVDRHLGRLCDTPVEALEQRAATGQHDALVHDVRHQLRRRLLDRVLDGLHDLGDRGLDGLADLVRGDLHRARQAGQQVAAAERDALLIVGAGVGRADGDLDVLGRSLADQQIELTTTVRDDVLVQLITADADAARDHDAAEADDSDLRGAATDVHDEAAGGLADGQAGTDGRRHGLLDESRPAGTSVECRVPDGALFHFRDARRDAQQHPGPRDQAHPVVHLLHEVLDHLLRDIEVADDPIPEWPHGDDARGRPADHPLGLGTDLQHLLGARIDGDHAGLADDDAPAPNVDQGVGRPEIDTDVAGEAAEEGVEHGVGWEPLWRWRAGAWAAWPSARVSLGGHGS